ncbi:MAG TPA: penicillin-binding transpeptidase domain-containing protein [Thermoleophilaceae bacterium]|nr:penicillin-binding transpeptidase domain-containing protein [Thermoleophilaceae bacterium]
MRPAATPRTRAAHQRAVRRRRIAAASIAAIALVSLGLGILYGTTRESSSQKLARAFTLAWERGDYGTMYEKLTDASQARIKPADFVKAYETARDTATTLRMSAGKPHDEGHGLVRVPMTVTTRIFGTVRANLVVHTQNGKIGWSSNLVFPGIPRGATLSRTTVAPPRAKLEARGGKVIAEGPSNARRYPAGSVAESIAGSLGEPSTAADRQQLYGRGFPAGTPVGLSGLERAFEEQLAGRPGGKLTAGGKVLAQASPRPAPPVRTTIDLGIQAAAVSALAGRFGGIAALDARTGEVRALAGVAFSAPQPPGSTFKLITATAVLEAHDAKLSTQFPVAQKTTIDGVDLQNANGEFCGGTLAQSFAKSCNSVFAPLGVKVGASRLVHTAEHYGFNEQPSIAGALPSTIPAPQEIGSQLALGSTAIGQGKVLATPLEMASVVQTIASHGIRHRPTLMPGKPPGKPVRVISRRIAKEMRTMMLGVVQYGTGVRAAIPGTTVAGKTGTAELESTVPKPGEQPPPGEQQAPAGSKTDAWFAGFAPATHPKLAVCVMLVRAGAGGDTAAPAAATVLSAGL